jgi:hypothetical protein
MNARLLLQGLVDPEQEWGAGTPIRAGAGMSEASA